MRKPTDLPDVYFNWLYDQLFKIRNIESYQSYTTMCRVMHQVVFKSLVHYDSNRIAVAADFRNQYVQQFQPTGLVLANLLRPDATVLEVLYGLARQADDMIPLMVPTWFEIFYTHLGLKKYNDEYCLTRPTQQMTRIVNRFNNRDYRYDGTGGIFPLRHAQTDQREVELWYQMGAYMTEQGMY